MWVGRCDVWVGGRHWVDGKQNAKIVGISTKVQGECCDPSPKGMPVPSIRCQVSSLR